MTDIYKYLQISLNSVQSVGWHGRLVEVMMRIVVMEFFYNLLVNISPAWPGMWCSRSQVCIGNLYIK